MILILQTRHVFLRHPHLCSSSTSSATTSGGVKVPHLPSIVQLLTQAIALSQFKNTYCPETSIRIPFPSNTWPSSSGTKDLTPSSGTPNTSHLILHIKRPVLIFIFTPSFLSQLTPIIYILTHSLLSHLNAITSVSIENASPL